jgi:H+/Cl- antiporter ClcA
LCCWPVLRSASFLGGLMRMSASMCLILMEMTGRQAALLDTSRTDHLADM